METVAEPRCYTVPAEAVRWQPRPGPAGVAEQADARDSKSRGPWDREGSNPSSGTKGDGRSRGSTMIPPDLLEILCCPESHQPVRNAPPELLDLLNRAIAAGGLEAQDGTPITAALTGGLVREDGNFIYPIRNGIPIMLLAERIPVPRPTAAAEEEGAASPIHNGPGGSDEKVEQDGDAHHHEVKSSPGT